MEDKKNKTKLGEPTREQIEFTRYIYNEIRYLKRQQYNKLLKYKNLDVDELYSLLKEKYKLVKIEKHQFLDSTIIIIRFDKSSAVVISSGDTRILRFYEKDKLFTLNEMLYLYGKNNYSKFCTSRVIGSEGWAEFRGQFWDN